MITTRHESEWLQSFEARVVEATELAEVNLKKAACVAAAKSIIGFIEESDDIRMHGASGANEGDRADPSLPYEAVLDRDFSEAVGVASERSLSIGKVSVRELWLPLGYTYYPQYFYIRELDNTEEDEVMWSLKNDARVKIKDYAHFDDEPGTVNNTSAYLEYVRDDIEKFDERVNAMSETLKIALPSWEEVASISR